MIHACSRFAVLSASLSGVLWAGGVAAQDAAPAAPAAPATAGATEPMPWYVGVGQGFFYDSNVYRVPGGPGDTYSNTVVFGGFDQRLSRQRIFGSANVGLNRYFDETQLDNTSYDFLLGLDWETAGSLSGTVDAGMRQFLSAPAASAGVPVTSQNLAKTKFADARVRWGGTSLLTLEGTGRYSSIDYSDPTYISSETSGNSASLTLYYGGGGPLRLGVGGRYDRSRTPNALLDPLAGTYQSNTATGRHLDFFADYQVLGQIVTNLRLSYTKQENSLVEAADFSGLTGRLGVNWQATGKVSLNAYVSRDAGFDSSFSSVPVVPPGAPDGTPPLNRVFENNRLTYAADLGVAYLATAKIRATLGAHYTRAHLISTSSDSTDSSELDSTDIQRLFYLGADYAIQRNWSATCRIARALRGVTGSVVYSYDSNSIGCSTRFTWR